MCGHIGIYMHVHMNIYTRIYIHACVCVVPSFSSLLCPLQAGSLRQKPPSPPEGLIGSWVPRSWQGRGPACCAGGRSTRRGWSCPGPQPPLHSGSPARRPPGPRSHTAPGPTAPAVGKNTERGPGEPGLAKLGSESPAHTRKRICWPCSLFRQSSP